MSIYRYQVYGKIMERKYSFEDPFFWEADEERGIYYQDSLIGREVITEFNTDVLLTEENFIEFNGDNYKIKRIDYDPETNVLKLITNFVITTVDDSESLSISLDKQSKWVKKKWWQF